jgi:NAD(P)-dependent dehydrogenase (short-subunit alcohol dehydrogenase family)
MSFTKKRVVIIGGTSGIGLAVANLAARQGAQLVITGFKPIESEAIIKQLPAGSSIDLYQLDISNEDAVKDFFENIGEFDYLTTPGSTTPKGSFLTMDSSIAKKGFDSKFWGQYYAAKYGAPYIRKNGAIVFFSGVISQRPQPNLSVMASVNSAVEGLGRALAVELAPLRVNVIAPGFVDTPRYGTMSEADRQTMFSNLEKKLLVKHIGQSEELAEAVMFLLSNTYTTGTTMYVEGGYLLA